MAAERLGVQQRAALLTLMAEAREVSNPELKELTGFTLSGQGRLALNKLKLVDSRRVGRAYAHELTDDGWRWCAGELSAGPPPRSGSYGGAMYAVLANLRRFLNRSDLRLADIFAREDQDAGPPGRPAADARPRDDHEHGPADRQDANAGPLGQQAGGPDPAADIEARVRAAYARLAPRARAWVGLADLRPLLGGAPRAEVDVALRQLLRSPGVSLIPESNQKSLTDRDRAAAVRIGSQDHHLLAIDEP